MTAKSIIDPFIDKIPKAICRFGIVILFDDSIDFNDESLLLRTLFNMVDPARDIRINSAKPLIDATSKGEADGYSRLLPDDIYMIEEIHTWIDSKFREIPDLFLGRSS